MTMPAKYQTRCCEGMIETGRCEGPVWTHWPPIIHLYAQDHVICSSNKISLNTECHISLERSLSKYLGLYITFVTLTSEWLFQEIISRTARSLAVLAQSVTFGPDRDFHFIILLGCSSRLEQFYLLTIASSFMVDGEDQQKEDLGVAEDKLFLYITFITIFPIAKFLWCIGICSLMLQPFLAPQKDHFVPTFEPMEAVTFEQVVQALIFTAVDLNHTTAKLNLGSYLLLIGKHIEKMVNQRL